MRFQKVQQQAILLTPFEKEKLISILRHSYSIFNTHDNVTACPHCSSNHFVKNGTRNGFHKYICRKCKKNFTFRTNSSIKGIHKINAWNMFLEDFMNLNMTPVRELKGKIGVSEQTIFNWRHKLLSALENKKVKFGKEPVEFDESWFLISRKGRQEMNIEDKRKYRYWRRSRVGDGPHYVKLFFAYGRDSKKMELHKNHMGKTKKSDLEKYFTPDKLENSTILSDKHKTYVAFFEENNIEHKVFKASHHRAWDDKTVHVQSVNAFTRDFKDFVNKRLKGVSTKYMESYAKWYQFLHDNKVQVDKNLNAGDKVKFNITDNVCKEVVSDSAGLERYRRTEIDFREFLRENGRTDFGVCKNHYYSKAA